MLYMYNHDVIMNTYIYTVRIFSDQWCSYFDHSFSSALQRHPMGRYFWYESQDSTGSFISDTCWGKYVFIWLLPGKSVWYEVFLFVIDCNLAKTDSGSGRCSASCSVVVSLYAERYFTSILVKTYVTLSITWMHSPPTIAWTHVQQWIPGSFSPCPPRAWIRG